MLCFPPYFLAHQSNGFFLWELVLEISGSNQRKHFLLLLWGERFHCFIPMLRISMFSTTGLLCRKMPQEYKDDSFSPKEFWFRNSFLLTWRVYLAPTVVTVCLRGSEKWTHSTLVTVMKNPILTHALSFLTVIYTEISTFVSTSPGTAQSSKHTPILSNPSTAILFLQTQPTSSSSVQQRNTCTVATGYF